MSRNLPWLNELQPEMFAEIDPMLAEQRGIEDGGWLVVTTARAEIEARARVTNRMRPLRVAGQTIHQVALPWHWGYSGLSTGDSANELLHLSGDPNVSIETTRALTCDVRAGRRSSPATSRVTTAPHGHTAVDRDHPAEHNGPPRPWTCCTGCAGRRAGERPARHERRSRHRRGPGRLAACGERSRGRALAARLA